MSLACFSMVLTHTEPGNTRLHPVKLFYSIYGNGVAMLDSSISMVVYLVQPRYLPEIDQLPERPATPLHGTSQHWPAGPAGVLFP